ncbi:hypothetical protein KOM00_12830 [Geomonas sp. Red69]|uniref:Addiction module component n=1 Tax=Geomonas diazotrophica TaxID=2843197 RepID=A0ABX8JQC0_9BACT|nr:MULTISPECIES: hypothetical protein [Geomonas]MBU5637614.1 hypothetical protein [Geomonas diazotrophica]QWV99266.1 hypothetical protein KP005_08335 [Geomonas nitrogeniifigens]QXE88433.1 hypothetical protein KP003_08585 [Geomonas nitrogeniifigens]
MDDETFKNEVLDRLQQIIEMLTSILPEACIEEAGETPASLAATETAQASNPYGIDEEMQDGYRFAREKWNLEHGGA